MAERRIYSQLFVCYQQQSGLDFYYWAFTPPLLFWFKITSTKRHCTNNPVMIKTRKLCCWGYEL